ncbi:hypothetical protein [Streptomyces sp. NPDC049944]|uniref:hypothetical protein n=1 Tax=Streptomyces sp. NPDC049944 TaxID=3155657 RepID=UPI003437CA52
MRRRQCDAGVLLVELDRAQFPLTALNRDIPAYGSHAARTLLGVVADGSAPGFEDTAARPVPRGSAAPPR